MATKDFNRQTNGQFGTGNDGGGRPIGSKGLSTEAKEAIAAHGTAERVNAVLNKLLILGLQHNNVTALVEYLNRVVGKPRATIAVEQDDAPIQMEWPSVLTREDVERMRSIAALDGLPELPVPTDSQKLSHDDPLALPPDETE